MQCVLYEQGAALVRVCNTAWGLQDRKQNPMALERDRMVGVVANVWEEIMFRSLTAVNYLQRVASRFEHQQGCARYRNFGSPNPAPIQVRGSGEPPEYLPQ